MCHVCNYSHGAHNHFDCCFLWLLVVHHYHLSTGISCHSVIHCHSARWVEFYSRCHTDRHGHYSDHELPWKHVHLRRDSLMYRDNCAMR